jgi:hypothetical protein
MRLIHPYPSQFNPSLPIPIFGGTLCISMEVGGNIELTSVSSELRILLLIASAFASMDASAAMHERNDFRNDLALSLA